MNERHHVYTGKTAIRWNDTDPYGHINHTTYLTYMEEVRLMWLQDVAYQDKGKVIFPIVEAHANYKKSLTYPGNVVISVFAEPPSKTTWKLYHEVRVENDPDTVYATAWINSVCVDKASGRLIAVPDDFRVILLGG